MGLYNVNSNSCIKDLNEYFFTRLINEFMITKKITPKRLLCILLLNKHNTRENN